MGLKEWNIGDLKPRPIISAEEISEEAKQKQMKEVKYMPDLKGVKETKDVLSFIAAAYDAIYEARADDGKLSWTEIFGIGAAVSGKAIAAFSGISEVPDEIKDDLSDADIAELAKAFDEAKNLKGDTRDAAKELVTIVADLKNWGFKYFGKPEAPPVG